ncbi:MAG TPA: hypothetical protein VFL97_08510 [Nitrococcus sp.]|nr:hypothetical protein [Nitrococcus sp.]
MIGIQYQQSPDMDVGGKMRAYSVSIITAAILALGAGQAMGAGDNINAGDNDALAWHSPMHPQFELTTQFSNQLNFRFGINRFDTLSPADQLQNALVDETTPTFAASALVDWQVLPGGLHVTGGALYGDLGWSYLDRTAGFAAERSYVIPNHALDHSGQLDKIKPYLGLGWNNQFGPEGRFRLQLDLGLVFQGVPPGNEGALSADYAGNTSDDAGLWQTFQSFRYSPLFSAGFRYQF